MALKKGIEWGIISAGFYVAAQVLANVASTKIASIPHILWATDGGTLIYPLTFILRDIIHKMLGKRVARQVVVAAGFASLFSALAIYVVGLLPSDPSWTNQAAYDVVLLPVFRITLASILAQVVSELIDTEIFSYVIKIKKLSDTVAVLSSNFVSLVVDSLLFVLLAFGGILETPVLVQIIVTNILIKVIMSLLSTPAIWAVKRTVPFEEL